jgi:WD40 repeat protein
MTGNAGFDRRIFDFLDREAGRGSPDYLDDILSRTARTRQRPAWTSIERWLPVDLSTHQSVFNRPAQMRSIAILVALALLIAAFVALAVGSQRRILEPYGLARNGAIVSSLDGDIYAIDPATSAQSVLIGGDPFDFAPTYSRDGSRFLFLRSAGVPPTDAAPMLRLMVANADGSDVRALSDEVSELSWFDWSPSGSQIAYVGNFGTISVVNVDGSGTRTLDVGRPAHFVTWLPPHGSEILFRGEHLTDSDPAPGIFGVRPDGTGFHPISTKPASNGFDYQSLTVSPDGSRISFSRFSDIGTPSAFTLDLRTGEEKALTGPAGTSQRGGAVFSPDGKLAVYTRLYPDGSSQLVIAPADGSTSGIVLGPRTSAGNGGEGIASVFTPDGSAVIATYGQDGPTHRLPIDGSPGTIIQSGAYSSVDVQRLAP